MGEQVHRFRYYHTKPIAINCLSLNRNSDLLAIARRNASIEIWDLQYSPYLLKFITGNANGSVEAIGWAGNRLLATGLTGSLVEWDLEKLSVKTTVLLTGYAAWCLDVSSDNTLVAVGTEQGYVNLYTVENDDIVYKKLFDKQEGRILCCKFNTTRTLLVTGSENIIRLWNVETGHATNRISVSRQGKDVIVWCLAVLSDNTIISGDSVGRLSFWDGNVGDQIESFTTHKADILSITVSEDEKSLFCSGVDPILLQFVKIIKHMGEKEVEQWVKSVQRNIHEHDVRGVALNGETLISVGVDGYLTFSSYPPKWVMRLPPMLPGPRSAVCASKKLVLLKYVERIEVWALGSAAIDISDQPAHNNYNPKKSQHRRKQNFERDTSHKHNGISNIENHPLRLAEKPVKLAVIRTKGNVYLRFCTMSPSGEFIVYTTDTYMKILKLGVDDNKCEVSLSRLKVTGISTMCDRVAFSADSRTMAAHCSGLIHILHIDPEAGATVNHTIKTSKYLRTTSILHMTFSANRHSDVYLAVADCKGGISVWKRGVKKFEHHVTMPTYHCVPSALTIDSKQNIVVVYVDQKVLEYDLVNKTFTNWPGQALPPEWIARKSAIISVHEHPKRDAFVFQDDTSLWIMEKKLQEPDQPEAKRNNIPGSLNIQFKILEMKYLAGFHWLGVDEAITLEVLPEQIVSRLPAVTIGKRHGVS